MKGDAGRLATLGLLLNREFIHQVVGRPHDCSLRSFPTVMGLLHLRERSGATHHVQGNPNKHVPDAWALGKELMETFLYLTFSAINEEFEF